jgi:ATP-dependent RNA helicase DDX56/DBP9
MTSSTSSILDPDHTFASLADQVGLDGRLRKAVARRGLIRPTLVQSRCLPLALREGRDLLVGAATGSGKTLAYALPVLQRLLSRGGAAPAAGVGAIVLVPTRELCSQVHEALQQLCYYCDDVVKTAVLSVGTATVGGRLSKQRQEELEKQQALLRDEPNCIVATPTGLLTQIRAGALNDLKNTVETVVVDEADLVLSFGYRQDLDEIVRALPRIYQGMLLSATLSPELDSLKQILLHSPVTVRLEQEEVQRGQLKQFYVALPASDKRLLVYVFLKLGLLKGKGLFFVGTTDAGYRLKLFLEQFHIRSAVLNAELPCSSRLNIIEQFNLGNFDYLIATDASADAADGGSGHADGSDQDEDEDAKKKKEKRKRKEDVDYGVSRGMDFRNVSFVVNYDFPPNPRSYAHRVGRTARGGAKGVALSLVDIKSPQQMHMLVAVQEAQPRIPLADTVADTLQAVPADQDADQPQPVPLDFDLQELEGFRYRVEDVGRAVTRTAVRETRTAEIKAELLNSERLQSHFEENPADLQLLTHDRLATHVSRVQDHLKHVPKYLLPRGMHVANLNRKRKKRKRKKGRDGARRSDNDPLQSFDGGDVTLDGIRGDDEQEDPLTAEFMVDDDDDDEEEGGGKRQKTDGETNVFADTRDGTGRSTAGRNAWKEKHRKGKFSSKKRKSERKNKQPLGI